MTSELRPTCSLCGQDEDWHRKNRPMHKFNASASSLRDEADRPRGTNPSAREDRSRAPIDAALRYALVKKGVLSPRDLEEAQAELELALRIGVALRVELPSALDETKTADEAGADGAPGAVHPADPGDWHDPSASRGMWDRHPQPGSES